MASIAVFQKIGPGGKKKVFKRNNRHNHTHAFGIRYKTLWDGKERCLASWGASEALAKLALKNRMGDWNSNPRIQVLDEECVAVQGYMA